MVFASLLLDWFNDIGFRAVIVAATCNAACALVGCFLVLRRMSLMGDALSHSILPGLVIALLVAHDGGPLAMMAGALAAGVVTTLLTRLAHRHGGVAADASLGIVYTSLFAFGVVLVKQRLADVHFDISCVYEGSLMQVALDTVPLGSAEIPRGLLVAAPVLGLCLATLALLWKEWKLTAFDPALAATMGFAPGGMHYLLMLLVSVVVMTSFEAIGSILVIAMLIAPAAAAQVLVDRLWSMLGVTVALAVTATCLGFQAAVQFDVSPAGCIAVTAGGLYALAALFGPRHGVLSRMAQHLTLALRVRREDLLARLYRDGEVDGQPQISTSAAAVVAGGGWLGSRAVSQLLKRGYAESTAGGIRLTELGTAEGKRLVRSHRLWETYLVEQVGLPTDHVHDPAHRVEHFLDPSIDDEIQRSLDDRVADPHGREIPDKVDSETDPGGSR